ncbi:V-type ATP synthase subunit K [Entomospira nematocerorum]|uniref:V-type ATP synthase subunit K n=1 Tax=Entomospira nematocerorum TaxID=2719987 RepID=A0A968GGQ9_9SPIO|nr:V-type ATP synthase subunit K [Entomospira nematocera]NIZ47531.1 V-type ATP synthase subunit K [Entomospira nematocera]WDI33929.1 V-type ATP synthase subunit K [Entomospira nematocera]
MNELMPVGFYLAFAIPSLGSAIGCGIAAQAAVGAWKKAFLSGKGANMLLLALVGAPMTQVFYGFILMGAIRNFDPALSMIIGLIGGIAIATTAVLQGRASAYACDSLGETGKGFGQYLIALGIIETIAIFVMVFSFGVAG